MASAEESSLGRPGSPAELFLAFTKMALQGFGGVLPIVHRELVERLRWVEAKDFVETLTLAQALPGPNVINLALMLGDRWFGWRGSLAAMGGLLALPFVIVMALAIAYGQVDRHPVAVGALRGMGIVAAGLVVSTALKLLKTLKTNPLGLSIGLPLVATMIVLVAILRVPLLWILPILAPVAIRLAWNRRRGK